MCTPGCARAGARSPTAEYKITHVRTPRPTSRALAHSATKPTRLQQTRATRAAADASARGLPSVRHTRTLARTRRHYAARRTPQTQECILHPAAPTAQRLFSRVHLRLLVVHAVVHTHAHYCRDGTSATPRSRGAALPAPHRSAGRMGPSILQQRSVRNWTRHHAVSHSLRHRPAAAYSLHGQRWTAAMHTRCPLSRRL